MIGADLRRILLSLFREGFLPLLAFYVAEKRAGLEAGLAAAVAVSGLVYLYERRSGQDGLLVRLSVAFVLVQAMASLVSRSGLVFLAGPVVASTAWGIAFLVSVALRRPLAGALASSWGFHPREHRATDEFKRVYGVESVVWGVYLLSRAGIRLVALTTASTGFYVVVVFLTGLPAAFGLFTWSIWYARREFVDEQAR